ncbi:MAG: DNA-binding GntR family transcriptional regulator [Alteromonadaceae bacterium]|jgi:DNA-binding GntR family transcriptional regulator
MKKISLSQQIKDDIRADKLPVDQLLTQQWLSDHYQVSRIPVRDAIQGLSSQGWLIAHGKKGVKVPPLNAAQAKELYLMRLPLESLALQLAFEHLSFAVLGEAEDILAQLADIANLDPLTQGKLNWQFHCCLYQLSDKSILLRTLQQLHEHSERYLGFQSQTLQYHHRSEHEHYLLLEALRAKDLDCADGILKRHIEAAGKLLVEYFIQLEINPA